jgi:hypothetical protein
MQELHATELAAARFPLEHRLVEQRPLRLWPIGLTPPQLRHLSDYSERMYAYESPFGPRRAWRCGGGEAGGAR